jgi:hypothetical protein
MGTIYIVHDTLHKSERKCRKKEKEMIIDRLVIAVIQRRLECCESDESNGDKRKVYGIEREIIDEAGIVMFIKK